MFDWVKLIVMTFDARSRESFTSFPETFDMQLAGNGVVRSPEDALRAGQ